MRKIYASLELNNQSLKLVVAEMINNELYVLAAKEVTTSGIEHGRVIDEQVVSGELLKLKSDIETMLGINLNQVLILVSQEHINYQLVSGYSTITNEEKLITTDDLTRAIQASVYNQISDGEELVTMLPIEFSVDGEKVDYPISQKGEKLFVKGVMVTVPKRNIEPLVHLLDIAGIKVIDAGISGLADYFYLFHKEPDLRRGVIANINTDLTTISYFNKGIIVNSEVINVGTINIIKDLSYVFNLHYTEAKKLFERFAMATTRLANVNEVMTVINKEQVELTLNQYEVSEVVMARLVEIFKLAKISIKNLTKKEISYIIFTGVATETPGFKSLLKETVGTGIKIGESKTMGARENSYVSLLGNIYYYVYKMRIKGKPSSMFKSIENLDIKHPKTGMLNKIFNYFKED